MFTGKSTFEVKNGCKSRIRPVVRRIPYRVITKELDVSSFRKLGIAMRDRKNASLAVKILLIPQ